MYLSKNKSLLFDPHFVYPEIQSKSLRASPDLHVTFEPNHVTVTLPSACSGVHLIQLMKPLTKSENYFQVEITVAGESGLNKYKFDSYMFPL